MEEIDLKSGTNLDDAVVGVSKNFLEGWLLGKRGIGNGVQVSQHWLSHIHARRIWYSVVFLKLELSSRSQ